MKLVILFALLINSLSVYAQDTCKTDNALIFKKEVLSIIDSVRKNSYDNDREFEIFVARFYHLDKDRKDFSFTLGYIVNSNEFNLMKANYYVAIGKETLIIRLADTSFLKELRKIGVKKFDAFDHTREVQIVQKMFPKDLGLISYEPFGVTCYSRMCKFKKTFFQSSEDIPREISIYDEYPTEKIEKVDMRNNKNSNQTK